MTSHHRSVRAKAGGQPGFTLPELLLVLVVIALLAMIAVPALLNALQNARQKRSMSAIRTLATAVEQYSIDHGAFPSQSSCGSAGDIHASVKAYTKGNKKKKAVDETGFLDGWGHELRYRSEEPKSYTVCSGGKDGSDCCVPDSPPGRISEFENDLIFSTGIFVTFPEGKQE